MSKSKKTYTPDFKVKVVLDLLSGELTLNQVSSKYGVTPKSVQAWKKTFMSNASLAFNVEGAVSGYKEKIAAKNKEVSELHRQLGKRTAELEWVSKKLKSLDFKQRKNLVEPKHNPISVVKQCQFLALNRSTHYYESSVDNSKKEALLQAIDAVYTEIPFYGYRKVHQSLLATGHRIGVNRVRGYMYLAAVIDWHSKAILSHKVSNTMDSTLVIDVLNKALEVHGTPEIFNADQGSNTPRMSIRSC